MYNNHKKNKIFKHENSNITFISRSGYGYIKRRIGLLSSEIDSPIYNEISKK